MTNDPHDEAEKPPAPSLRDMVAARFEASQQKPGAMARGRLRALFENKAVRQLRQEAREFGVENLFLEDNLYRPAINVCGIRLAYDEASGRFVALREVGAGLGRHQERLIDTADEEAVIGWMAARLADRAVANEDRRHRLEAAAQRARASRGRRLAFAVLFWGGALSGVVWLVAEAARLGWLEWLQGR